jgi:hypothetical protein
VTNAEKPTLLVYGNCQAGAVGTILGIDPILTEAYNVRYLPSFDDRVPGSRDLAPEVIARTALLLEQYDPNPFPFRDKLAASCRTLTFPSVDLNLLWPLRCVNPLNDPPTEAFPWGHYPEGDRVILDCVQRGLSADETVAYYQMHAGDGLPDLDRYRDMEQARLKGRDSKCSVTMSDFVFTGFLRANLFWCANHPTMAALRELCVRLLKAAADVLPEAKLVDVDRTIAVLPPQGPLGFLCVPIHPAIVEHFDLEWYRQDEGRNYGLRDFPMTYVEYLHGMASTAIQALNAKVPT